MLRTININRLLGRVNDAPFGHPIMNCINTVAKQYTFCLKGKKKRISSKIANSYCISKCANTIREVINLLCDDAYKLVGSNYVLLKDNIVCSENNIDIKDMYLCTGNHMIRYFNSSFLFASHFIDAYLLPRIYPW